jgi:hypothetical protein
MPPCRTGFATNAKAVHICDPAIAHMRLVNSLCAIHEYEIAENSIGYQAPVLG